MRGAETGRYPLPSATFFPRSIPASPPGPPRGHDGGLDVFCRLLLTSPSGPRPPNLMFEPERGLVVAVGWDPPDCIFDPERTFDPERKVDAERGLKLPAKAVAVAAPEVWLARADGFHFFPGSFL